MKIIIVHGCADNEKDNPAGHWMPWIKKKLTEKHIETLIPLMPKSWKPNYENWKREFDKLIIKEDDILIGHSCGCSFLVRWLGGTGKKIKKLILVAPWKISDKEDKKRFCDYEIKKFIKNNVNEIIIFTSNDEEEDGKKSVNIFHKFLGGEVVELKNHGHFTFEDMGTEEFPELLGKILE